MPRDNVAANDNALASVVLSSSIDRAVAGQAITVRQSHRKHGKSYGSFVAHAGDGRHILVSKLISSMWHARWTKPLKVARADVMMLHGHMAKISVDPA